MEKKRSVGLTMCGIMMLCYSLWLLASSYTVPPLTFLFRMLPVPIRAFSRFFRGLPLLTGLIALIYLFCSIGILKLKNWARSLTIYFTILLLLPCIYIVLGLIISTVRGELEGPAAIGYLPIFLVIPCIPFLVPLIYLTRPKVKEQFK